MWVSAFCSFRRQSLGDYVPLVLLGTTKHDIAAIPLSDTIICHSVKAGLKNRRYSY